MVFLFCGIPGLILFFYSMALIISYFVDLRPRVPHPSLSAIGVVASLLLMLVGVGRWKQWRYLVVFIVFPLSIFCYIIVEPRLVASEPETVWIEVLGAFIFSGAVTFLTSRLVTRSYGKGSREREEKVNTCGR
jgi:hypothetical protein